MVTRAVALRLTLLYLAIIMTLSVSFSAVIYRLSTEELRRGARTPGGIVILDEPWRISFEQARHQQAETARQHLLRNLVLLNLGTLVVGAALSYGLARRTLQPIEEAFEAQGRFTADASHELRTPLTAMQTSLEVSLRNPKLTLKDAKNLIRGTLDEVQKLSSLANGLLKLTRNNGADLPKLPVSLASIAEAAASQLELAARNKHITIKQVFDSQVMTLGDDVSLKEVAIILLDNAIKYSRKHTTITLAARRQGKHALLSVADEGPGINATDLQYIFDRFYRADTSRSRDQVEGYGLGLSIAQKIVRAHGGAIDATSRPGEGATFTVTLPSAPQAES